MPRKLKGLRIDEVSVVDRGANQHAQIVLRKRDDLVAFYRRIFGAPPTMLDKATGNSGPRLRKDPDEEADDERGHAGDETVAAKAHFVSTLADLLVEGSEGAFTRQSALHYLMRTPHGGALVRRLHLQKKLNKQKERTSMTNRNEELMSIAKQYGPVAVAKHIIDKGESSISEHEFVAMVDAYAKSKASNFVAMYTANDDDGLAIRKATQILKGFGTAGPVREAVAGGSAYDQLMVKADELRKRDPGLTREQSFAKVFSDPVNRELAARERSENRPRAA
jgi:hypothetical protein